MSNTQPGRAPHLVITWVPIAIAVASFIISGYTFVVTSQSPVVELILPQTIRIAQGEDFGYAYSYFQPTLVSTGRSQQVAVVREMNLDFAPADGSSDGATFDWRESGNITYDPQTRATSYVYQNDAAPLLISRETAQSPLGTFYGPPDWYFTPGKWRGTLTATLAGGLAPIRMPFVFSITDADASAMQDGGGSVYVTLEIGAG